MTLKRDAKFERKLTCGLENDMRNLANFNQNTWKCQNLDFDRILVSKEENAWAKNLQRSRRMMKNLQRDWLFVSKLTWGIWQIFIRALKSLKNFNVLLLRRLYAVWAKEGQRSYRSWHWRVMQNLERNWLVVSKLIWGIWQILTQALESFKNLHFNGPFLTKIYNVWAKKVQRNYVW